MILFRLRFTSLARAQAEAARMEAECHELGLIDRRKEWSERLVGCAAELAVAIYTGERWTVEGGPYRRVKGLPDVGRDIDVKWTKYPDGHLIIREHDVMIGRRFALVTGEHFDGWLALRGWLHGADAPKTSRVFKGTPNHYRVPQQKLRPIEELRR